MPPPPAPASLFAPARPPHTAPQKNKQTRVPTGLKRTRLLYTGREAVVKKWASAEEKRRKKQKNAARAHRGERGGGRERAETEPSMEGKKKKTACLAAPWNKPRPTQREDAGLRWDWSGVGERGVNKGETKKEEGWTGGGRGGGWQGGESREGRRPCLLSPPFFPAPLCRRAGILTCVDWAALVEGIMRVCVCLISARGGCSVRQRGGVVKKTHGVGFGPRALAKGPPRAERARKKQGCAAGKGGGARSPPLPRTTTASWRHGARPVRAGEACARGRAWGEGRRRTKKGAGDERRGGGEGSRASAGRRPAGAGRGEPQAHGLGTLAPL